MTQNIAQNQPPEQSVFTLQDVFTIVRFVYNAVFRHKLIMIICFVVTVSLAVFAVKILPRTYQITSRIMTASSTTITSLASQSGRRYGNPSATDGVPEIMKSRENLLGIIDDADLVERWKKTRHKTGRFIDGIFRSLFGPPSDKDLREALVNTLESRLEVWVEGNIIVIRISWHEPQSAFEIEQVVINRFFEERRTQELAEIRETIRLLEEKYAASRAELEEIAAKNENLISKTSEMEKRRPRRARPARRIETTGSAVNSAEYDQVSAELVSLQREIARLNNEYERQLSAEKSKLAQIETTYGPQHPDIIKSKRYIELLEVQEPVPPELKEKERSLSVLLEKLENTPTEQEAAPIRRPSQLIQKTDEPSRDDVVELTVQSQLTSKTYGEAQVALSSIGQRLSNAKMELEATELAFNYRYRLTRPPIQPKRPVKPNGMIILAGAVFLSIFMGIFFAVFVDIRSGRIIEGWQVEKILNVPLLGEIEKK